MRIPPKGLSAAIALAIASSGITSQAQAAGFALIENSASGMGNAFAGASAIAEDGSTIYFNPAGMTYLSSSQINVAGHIVAPQADYTDTASTVTGTNDDGGVTAFVPNFYYAKSLGEDMWFGVGVNAPFGLSTEYDEDWVGRYHATLSELMTVNINPSFAAKATEAVSVGFGLNIQYIEATLGSQLDSAVLCVNFGNPGCSTADSSQELSGDDWSIGWNFGFMFDLDEASRLGVAYRSSVKQDLTGSVDFNLDTGLRAHIDSLGAPTSALFTDTDIKASINLPETLSVSYYRDMSPKLAIMADITLTKWSNFEDLIISFDTIQPASVTPEDWTNSMRYSVGMNYQYSDTMTYRAGIAYDETPIRSADLRTPRIPGNDRTWLSFGIGYNISTDMSVDVGYSHLFVDDTDINSTNSFGTLTGTYEAAVDILSVQGNFKF